MQINTILKSFIAAGALSLSVAAADAATVTYTFNASSTPSITLSGLTLDLGVAEFNAGGSTKTLAATAGTLLETASGLGMDLAPGDSLIDSVGVKREAVTFHFSQAVMLTNVTFASATIGTDKAFLVFHGGTSTNPADLFALTGSSFSLGTAYVGTDLGIGAKGGSSFYISSITVQTVERLQPVPVPAAGLLLGSLALVPMLRRKRRA